MSKYHLTATVTNKTGNTISAYWIKHKPHSSSERQDWSYSTNLANNGTGPEFTIELESDETDVWNVVWTDKDNNLFESGYEFSGSANHKNGPVSIVIQIGSAAVLQDSQTIARSDFEHAGSGQSS